MKDEYIDARVEFEKDLYSYNGTLFFNFDPKRQHFYHSITENDHTVMKGYGPNPMGLVDAQTTVTGNITLSDETIRFCVRSEIIPENIKQIINAEEKGLEHAA